MPLPSLLRGAWVAAVLWLAAAPAGAVPPGYHLVWSDEFDSGRMPSPDKWRYDTRRNRDGWFNGEAQYYSADRPQNARIDDGQLIIEARHESLAQYPDYGGQAYSSARLITDGTARWTYGFFEIRARLSCTRGAWPAIWLMGDHWPAGGEIDIMEQLGFDPGTIYGTAHTPWSVAHQTPSGAAAHITSPCTAFHRYQVEWTRDAVTFLVDDTPYHTYRRPAHATAETWPFDQPEFLILNVAVGGGWAGQKGIDDNGFPDGMAVDYVRVYQR
jgi:beta-glucanase (GH16 family)